MARPNRGILKVSPFEAGLGGGRGSKEGCFRVEVRWWAGGVGGNEGTKSSNEDGREAMVWVDEMEGRVSIIAGTSDGEPCGLLA